ncbi:MAG: hypothetical protein LQ338_004988 [Usnochroma carphineum]|nr:MAG: hypothetical protein LQ338_004988 [Usnochroma carphineum]
MPTTRRKAALRRAEGLPPSPQNEDDIPRELRGPQRRKKRTNRSTRSTAPSESEEDPAPQQDQGAPAQALREGNAGGYIRDNTSEQQAFLSENPSQSSELQSERLNEAQEHRGSNEATTALQDLPEGLPVESVPTPPHSPTLPNSLPVTPSQSTASTFRSILSKDRSTQGDMPGAQPAVKQATATVSVSTQTDGQVAATASAMSLRASTGRTRPSMHTATTQTSPITLRTSPETTEPCTRTASVQTDAPEDRFRSMGLYTFRSELSAPPESCSITLHLGDEREIRISKTSAAALDRIRDVLHDRDLVFERNWLTPEEAAAESAAAVALAAQEAEAATKEPRSSANRKRDMTNDETSNARWRCIDPATSPTPLSTLSPNPFRLRSRLRRNGGVLGRSQSSRSSMPSVVSSTNQLAAADSTVRYGRDGNLRLLGTPRGSHQENGSNAEDSVAVAVTTGNDSDDEGDSDSILEWPQDAPYWSIDRHPMNQAVNTSSQAAATEPEPDSRQTEHPSEEPTTPTVETLQPSGWRIGSIFSTARRFIPGIRQQQVPPTAPQTIRPATRTQDMVNSQSAEGSHREAQTEPRRQDRGADQAHTEPTSNFAQRLRDSRATMQKGFRTKENIEEIKKVKAEKEKLKAEWAKLEEERRITEQERKDVEDAHRAAYASHQPGSKRRLIPSPRVIPNPKGVSYGLDPAYFVSSDEDEEPQTSPTRTYRMRKARRVHGPDRSQPDKDRGLNDKDSLFSHSARTSSNDQALQYHGSLFSDSQPNAFQLHAARNKARKEASKGSNSTSSEIDTSSFNHKGHFQVPLSPSSSEEDEAEDGTSEQTPSEEQPAPSSPDKGTDGGLDSVAQDTGTQGSSATAAAASSMETGFIQLERPATPEQAPRAVRFANGIDPSKTLERSRQMLRDQVALQGGKSIPSPQDIANNPRKLQLTKPSAQAPTTQSSAPERPSFVQQEYPGKSRGPVEESFLIETNARTAEDDFSIRGAADRTPPKSPARLLAETLPTVYGSIDKLQAYKDFQQEMDPRVKEALESSWEDGDDEESAKAFKSALAAFRASEQPEIETPAVPTTTRPNDNAEPFVDDVDDDSALFYSDDDKKDDQTHGSAGRILSAAQPEAAGDQSLDSAVAALLDSSWTPEDEAYASDEFKENWATHKELNAVTPEPGPTTA